MPGIATNTQDDWSAGGQTDVAPALIDKRGFLRGKNVLLDNDGSGYKRGGSLAKTVAYGTSLRWGWEGFLAAGRRTLIASDTKFGVLAADDTTIVDLGGAGFPEPRRAWEIGGILHIGGGILYGGSRKAADYSTGTVTATLGSKTIVGVGTSWTANVDAGMLLRIGTDRVYVVDTVTDNTHIVLADKYEGSTVAGSAYTLKRLEAATGPYQSSKIYAVGGGRLFAVLTQNIVRFSSVDPVTTKPQPHVFATNDFHNVPEGVEIIGLDTLTGQLVIFTSAGIWVLDGIAYNLADALGNPQQTLSKASGDLILWGNAGIAHFQNALVAPCLDGVYLIDGKNEPQNVGKGIRRTYRRYVDLGYKPGGAYTYRNHYFLPILNAINQWVDTLVCRLDRPVRARQQTLWPWTQLDGAGARCSAFFGRSAGVQSGNEPPALLATQIEDGKLLDVADYLGPVAANALDHDGNAPAFELVTRDFPTSDGGIGRVRKARLLYEMIVDGTPNPRVYLDIGLGAIEAQGAPKWDEVKWDEFQWAGDDEVGGFQVLTGSFGPDPGVNKGVWWIRRRAPYVRFRIRQSDPVASFTVRAFEVGVIPSGGNRLSRISDD